MSRSQETSVSKGVWLIVSGKLLRSHVRTKSIIEFTHSSHFILSESTEPSVGVDWELFEVEDRETAG